ncbi:MAG: GAF domain-containing protein [Rhodoglobus sp.]
MTDHAGVEPSDERSRHWVNEVQDLLLETEAVEDFLQEAVSSAAVALNARISISVTIAREDRPVTVASSDAYAAQLDEVQYSQMDGPGLCVVRAGEAILIDDLVTDRRFRRFRPTALALGTRSCLALPLPLDQGNRTASLNLYARSSYSFGKFERASAASVADEVSRALQLAMSLAHQVELTEEMRACLNSRTLIYQTIGIIMGNESSTADPTTAVLRVNASDFDVVLLVRAAQHVRAASNHGAPRPCPNQN